VNALADLTSNLDLLMPIPSWSRLSACSNTYKVLGDIYAWNAAIDKLTFFVADLNRRIPSQNWFAAARAIWSAKLSGRSKSVISWLWKNPSSGLPTALES